MKTSITFLFFVIFLSGCATADNMVLSKNEKIEQTKDLENEIKKENPTFEEKKEEGYKVVLFNDPIITKKEKDGTSILKQNEIKEKTIPFKVGEKTEYSVSLKGINSGTAVIEVFDFKEDNYYFSAHIVTNYFVSLFFRVEHSIVSVWSVKKSSSRFSFKGVEGSKEKERLEIINVEKKKGYVANKETVGGKSTKKVKDFKIESPVEDFLSSFFFVRTVNWTEEKTKDFFVLDDGNIEKVRGEYLGDEQLFVKNKKIETEVVSIILKKNNSSFNKFWIDKKTKELIKIQANLNIGLMTFDKK